MKVDILSDLHVEFNTFVPFIEKLQDPSSEVLICAGDMGPLGLDEVRYAFRELCRYYKRVIYVAGNHDYYRGSVNLGNEHLRSLEDWLPNLEILSPGKMTELNGYKVVGGTMWVANRPRLLEYPINDPFVIPDLMIHLDKMHKDCIKFFYENVDSNTIVVTHHLPSPLSVAPKYKDDRYNCWFLSDQSQLIREKKPAYWIHGHTHYKSDYQVDNTHIICNPYGYPSENRINKFGKLTYEI